MTSATERLRELLDERGVERKAGESEIDHVTMWKANGGHAEFYESKTTNPDLLQVNYYNLTPEQAIAATLGRGTCHMKHSQDECYDEHTGEEWSTHCWKCTACGEKVAGGATSNGVTAGPRFCPYCGREVVDE